MGLFDSVMGFAKKLAPTVQKAIGKVQQVAGGGGSASAADYFLKITDVEGESEDEKHKGEIEIVSFEFSAAQVGTGGKGTGSGAGKAAIDDVTFAMSINKASPKLFLACATGQHFPSAVLTARKAGGGQQEYLTVTFTEVLVTGFHLTDSGASDPVPMNAVTLNFAEIDIEYKPQNADGSVGAPVKVGFNIKANKKK